MFTGSTGAKLALPIAGHGTEGGNLSLITHRLARIWSPLRDQHGAGTYYLAEIQESRFDSNGACTATLGIEPA